MTLIEALKNILYALDERVNILNSLTPNEEDLLDEVEWNQINAELGGQPLPSSAAWGGGWGGGENL